jgi:two-component system response regulator CitB
MKVLIIDDEVEICMLLSRIMKKRAKEVNVAHSVREGIACIDSSNPDVIFLDNNLPDGQGKDYIKSIKHNCPNTKLIFISATTNIKDEVLNNGADYFFEKPVSLQQIDRVI